MQRILALLMLAPLLFAAGCADNSGDDEATAAPGSGTTALPAAGESLLGIVWEWTGTVTPVTTHEVLDPDRYTLRFQADGRVQAKFDCNNGSGSYDMADNRLSFGPLISTRMACPEDTQDALFMSQLQQISSYFLQNGDLFLEMPVDSGTMRFRNSAAAD